jgi:hypothetical protein
MVSLCLYVARLRLSASAAKTAIGAAAGAEVVEAKVPDAVESRR